MSVRALLTTLAVLAVLVLSGCGPESDQQPAQLRAELSGDSTLIEIFRQAESETGVPAELLATIAYAQTRLSMRASAAHHADVGHAPREWGLMAIGTGGLTSPEVAAQLSGASVELVKTDPEANVRAAAALLKTQAHARGVVADDVLGWAAALEAYGGQPLADEVEQLLRRGWQGSDDQGGSVQVEGLGRLGERIGVIQQGLGYPSALWNPADPSNYTNASRGAAQINYVIIHTVQGSYAGCISWFKNSTADVSAHYVVRSSDGEITQMVDDADIAWHDGCFNSETIGIEHEGYVDDPARWYTDAMYQASAKLTAWLCDQYGIPKDRAHIMGHGEAPDCSTHTDPGPGWDWTKYMGLVKNGGCSPQPETCNGKDDNCNGQVDEGGVCNQAPTGYLDGVACDRIHGWAQDPDAPTQSIDVHVYFGGPAGSGSPSVNVPASLTRNDLCGSLGSCEHAFELTAPLSLFDGQPHAVHAYGIDTAGGSNTQLTNSPGQLTCPASVPAGVRRHVINPESLGAWQFDLFWQLLPLTDTQIASIPAGTDLPGAPELVQADDGSPAVWLVDSGWRRHVPSTEVMSAWRFAFGSVVTKPAAEVNALPEGPVVRQSPVLVRDSSGRLELIDDPFANSGGSGGTGGGTWGGGGTAGGGASAGSGGSNAQQTRTIGQQDDSGCACRASGSSRSGSWLALLVALPLVLRRRAARRAKPRRA